MKTLLYGLAEICAVLTLVGALWSAGIAFLLLDVLERALRSSEYQPATLAVERLEIETRRTGDPRRGGVTTQSCWAEGTIDGEAERLELSDCEVTESGMVSHADVAAGGRVPVFLNRTISSEGMFLRSRVLRRKTDDFAAESWRRVRGWLPLVYGPMFVPAVLAFAVGGVSRKLGRPAGWWAGWVVAGLLGLQLLAVAAVEIGRRLI